MNECDIGGFAPRMLHGKREELERRMRKDVIAIVAEERA